MLIYNPLISNEKWVVLNAVIAICHVCMLKRLYCVGVSNVSYFAMLPRKYSA